MCVFVEKCPENYREMRPATVYGCILLICIIFTAAAAEKKFKYNDATSNNTKNNKNGAEKNKDTKYSRNKLAKNSDTNSGEENERVGLNLKNSASWSKANKGKLVKREADENSSEEETIPKYANRKEVNNKEPKRFIGRIEHGKVKVLKNKNDKFRNSYDDSEEVCRKSHGNGCNGNGNGESDESKPMKKIKYSIKFQHEKQKKKDNNGDISIMRLHKNGRKKYGRDDDKYDDDSSEEEDRPIKRFHLMEDDD